MVSLSPAILHPNLNLHQQHLSLQKKQPGHKINNYPRKISTLPHTIPQSSIKQNKIKHNKHSRTSSHPIHQHYPTDLIHIKIKIKF